VQTHNEYPKMMQHPHAKRGGTVKLDPNVADRRSNWQGEPDKFPPVLVHNSDQEEQYLAQGYWTAGTSSPEAFAAANASPIPADYVSQEYPKWVKGELALDADHELEIMLRESEESALEVQADALDDDAPSQRGRPRKVV
jgi:hypothetical protein